MSWSEVCVGEVSGEPLARPCLPELENVEDVLACTSLSVCVGEGGLWEERGYVCVHACVCGCMYVYMVLPDS